ncbi:ABC transporter permease [Bifidobacterium aemilianum]|uniref:ABC transporter permease n=1 Tax=Bifidobacterium aemilianum TaxID=2493120 RepID=UPI0013749B68|nr:ABC transporter permease [Bifidobacterium aemilianum]
MSETKPIIVKAMTLSAQDSSKSGSSMNDGGAGLTQVSLQLIVVPDGQSLDGYIYLEQAQKAKSPLTLPDLGALLTVNAAKLLNLEPGSKGLAEDDLHQGHSVTIADITNNYTGNSLYMTQSAYESAFNADGASNRHGSDEQSFKTNACLIKLKGDDQMKIATAKDLEQDETVPSVVSNQQLKEDFTSNYAIVKVLGFRRGEVHSYVNKETFMLTMPGIALGLPVGWGLTYPMVGMIKMPGIHFEVQTSPLGWLIVGFLALVFALAVMLITNRSLDRIDMVESLKSSE